MRWLIRAAFHTFLKNRCNSRLYSTRKLLKDEEIDRIRNIGILAHIDAGKTTTTERMLFYSGLIKHMGEVHHGNTVTDYMDQERERGITIKSAAVTFPWKNHQFNLIDTPGHIDFTMEVEQTLDVLDGAVITLDASAGVEAQTLTVWHQAKNIPKIIFLNKMDRRDADVKLCCESVRRKLDTPVLNVHAPIIENNSFVGVVDVVSLKKFTWNSGRMLVEQLDESKHSELFKTANSKRLELIDCLSNYDDNLADKIIESGSLADLAADDVINALRRVTIAQKAVPILCGSAYKNIGIETLMDAIIMYLPSPLEKNVFHEYFEDDLCARAFKILHDKQRGALTFLRIYSGSLIKGQKVFNIQRNITEQTGKLLMATADEFEEVERLANGNIAVLTGLKHTITGDLIAGTANIVQSVKKNKKMPAGLFETTREIPEPVFLCSIEPPNLASQATLEQALSELQREDPSLRVTHDHETGQIILGGMGELHLEIVKDRILKEYKVEADLGPLQISYRESPMERGSCDFSTDMRVGQSKHSVSISLSVILPGDRNYDPKSLLVLDKTREAASNIANIYRKHLAAVHEGVKASLLHGPKLGAQVINANIMLHMLEVGKGTTESVIVATTSQCIQKLLKQTGMHILEPVMWLEIVCQEEYLSAILADLSRRRSTIREITMRGSNKLVLVEVPLSELLGYSTLLRTVSSGTAVFSMEFLEYRKMSSLEENRAIESVRGF